MFTLDMLNFVLVEKALPFAKENFEWEEIFDDIEIFRIREVIPPEDIIVVVTKLKDKNEWFSAPNPKGTNEIFIDGSDWEN